jgi:hypothetical protein
VVIVTVAMPVPDRVATVTVAAVVPPDRVRMSPTLYPDPAAVIVKPVIAPLETVETVNVAPVPGVAIRWYISIGCPD